MQLLASTQSHLALKKRHEPIVAVMIHTTRFYRADCATPSMPVPLNTISRAFTPKCMKEEQGKKKEGGIGKIGRKWKKKKYCLITVKGEGGAGSSRTATKSETKCKNKPKK